jgi:hypothetical protein
MRGAPQTNILTVRASGGILTKEVEAAEEEAGPIDDRLSDCAERILAEPVRGSADLMLLAEACYWIMWAEPYGLTAPNADERLADGPPHADESGICMDALAALFRGIRDATRGASSSQPIVPAPAMRAPDVGASTALRAAYVASEWQRALSAYLEDRGRTSAEEELDALNGRLGEVTRTIIATPVRTPDDLVVRAAMAVHWNQFGLNDPAYPDHVMNSKACSDQRALAAVVRGVLDLAGLKFDVEGRLLDEEPAAA